jgi:hypothetical protein
LVTTLQAVLAASTEELARIAAWSSLEFSVVPERQGLMAARTAVVYVIYRAKIIETRFHSE